MWPCHPDFRLPVPRTARINVLCPQVCGLCSSGPGSRCPPYVMCPPICSTPLWVSLLFAAVLSLTSYYVYHMCETAYLLTCIPYIPYKHMVRVYACVNVYLYVCLPTCLSVYRPHRYEAISFAPHQTPSTQVGAQHVAETPLMDRGGETELHRPSHGAHLHWVQSAL